MTATSILKTSYLMSVCNGTRTLTFLSSARIGFACLFLCINVFKNLIVNGLWSVPRLLGRELLIVSHFPLICCSV